MRPAADLLYRRIVESTCKGIWPGESVVVVAENEDDRDEMILRLESDLWSWSVEAVTEGDKLPNLIDKAWVFPRVNRRGRWFEALCTTIPDPERNMVLLPSIPVETDTAWVNDGGCIQQHGGCPAAYVGVPLLSCVVRRPGIGQRILHRLLKLLTPWRTWRSRMPDRWS